MMSRTDVAMPHLALTVLHLAVSVLYPTLTVLYMALTVLHAPQGECTEMVTRTETAMINLFHRGG